MTESREAEAAAAPRTAHEQRRQSARPNRKIALYLLAGAAAMLAAAFAVALVVINGGS